MSSELLIIIGDAFFLATHPVLSLRVWARQSMVAHEREAPPHTSTWEEFPVLSLAAAARAIKTAEEKFGGGVPENAWSKSNQKRLANGQRPIGYPEHPNV